MSVSPVVFFEAVYPPLQPIGVGISPYTLAYTCEGRTEAIDACVISDCTNQVDIRNGDIFISVNGEELVNQLLSTEVHYDAVIAKLSMLTDTQRTIRFLRCSKECHDESVNAAIIVICPEEAALLFDPTHRDVCPEFEEVDFPSAPTQASSRATIPSFSHHDSRPDADALSMPNPQLHPYYSSNNLEDEVRREMQRLAEELRQAEEEDNRQIELEVQRQLLELVQVAPTPAPLATAAAGASTSSSAFRLQEEAMMRQLTEEQRLNDQRRVDDRREDDRRIESQLEMKRFLADERKELLRLQEDNKRESELRRERERESAREREKERESERRRAEEESRRMYEVEYHRRMAMAPPTPYMSPFFPPYGMPMPFPMQQAPGSMPLVVPVAAAAPAIPTAVPTTVPIAPALAPVPAPAALSVVDDALRRHVELLEQKLSTIETEQANTAAAAATAAIAAATAAAAVTADSHSHSHLEDLVAARIAEVEKKMSAEVLAARAAASKAEEESRRVVEILQWKEQAFQDERARAHETGHQQLLKEFLLAQEVARRGGVEARGTADALQQDEAAALQRERLSVEEERRRIEREKQLALAEIDQRMQQARAELDAGRDRAVREAEAREAELQVLEARAELARAAEVRALEEATLAAARVAAEARVVEEGRISERQAELDQLEALEEDRRRVEAAAAGKEKEERMADEVRRRVGQEAQRLREDEGRSEEERARLVQERRQQDGLKRRERIDEEVRRRVEMQKAVLLAHHHQLVEASASADALLPALKYASREAVQEVQQEVEIRRRLEEQTLCLDEQLRAAHEKGEAMRLEIEALREAAERDKAKVGLGKGVERSTAAERARLLEARDRLGVDMKRVQGNKVRALREADVVAAIELKHAHDGPWVDQTGSGAGAGADGDGMVEDEGSRKGRGRGRGQIRPATVGSAEDVVGGVGGTQGGAEWVAKEALRVTESAHLIADKIARLQAEQRRLEADTDCGYEDEDRDGAVAAVQRVANAVSIMASIVRPRGGRSRSGTEELAQGRAVGGESRVESRGESWGESRVESTANGLTANRLTGSTLAGHGAMGSELTGSESNRGLTNGSIPPAPTVPSRPLPGYTNTPLGGSTPTSTWRRDGPSDESKRLPPPQTVQINVSGVPWGGAGEGRGDNTPGGSPGVNGAPKAGGKMTTYDYRQRSATARITLGALTVTTDSGLTLSACIVTNAELTQDVVKK